MGEFMKGDIVVAPFPYSDLSSTKRRPALVIAPLVGDDVILYRAGILAPAKVEEVVTKIIQIITT